MTENDEILEKRNRKKKKYKRMKVWLGVFIALCVLLLAACAFAGFTLFKMNDSIESLTEHVSETKNELQAVQLTADELSAKYELAVSEKTQLATEKDALTAENLKLTQELQTLQESLSGSGASIEDLENQIEEKDKSISSLESKIKTLNSNISKLETQIKDLQAQLTSDEPEKEPEDEPKTEEPKEEVKTPETTEKIAYLTFDDGISDATNDILDILKKYNVKATFFVNFAYKKISGYQDIYKRIIDEGHTLGNHTSTHDFDSVYGSIEGFEKEVMSIHNSIKELTGYEMSIFRFPGGSNTTYVKKLSTAPHTLIHDLGYEYYDWNVDSGDATAHNVASETIINNVLSGSKYYNNAIILMHDLGYKYKRTTVEALPSIIEGLQDMGFTLKAMDSSVSPKQFTKDPSQ